MHAQAFPMKLLNSSVALLCAQQYILLKGIAAVQHSMLATMRKNQLGLMSFLIQLKALVRLQWTFN